MRLDLLERLRCPYCGGPLNLCESTRTVRGLQSLHTGVLGCECSAYPVLEGIPCLHASQTARQALRCLEHGDAPGAWQALGGGAGEETRTPAAEPATFREGLDHWCPGPEKEYLLHRFSDPTFVAMESLLRPLAARHPVENGWILDVCGGAGHATRLLSNLHPSARVVLADRDPGRLRLAGRFMAPNADLVCCDAAQPLPFRHGGFDWVQCVDGLNYVWPRRLLVTEMLRSASPSGVVLALHMHNALCVNPSAGMPLSPATFRSLFEPWPVRLYAESGWLAAAHRSEAPDLAGDATDEALQREPALCAVAALERKWFDALPPPAPPALAGAWAINPLYQVRTEGNTLRLERRFPSAYYEEEFGALKTYLPEVVSLTAEDVKALKQGERSGRLAKWIRQRVLLDLPEGYV